MKKRILSFILCICMLITSNVFQLPVDSAEPTIEENSAAHTVHITHDGRVAADLALGRYEKETLTANFDGEARSYQWQILADADNGIWASIFDKAEQECEVSMALVSSLLDADGCAYLRCAVQGKDDVTYYSGSVCIKITYDPVNPDNVTSFVEQEYVQSKEIKQNAPTLPAGAMARSGDAKEYVTVTIKYLDYNTYKYEGEESSIYTDYIATIEKGSEFTQNVLSPSFLGFAPFYDADGDGEIDDDASHVPFNEAAVNEDIVVKVYYVPVDVPYAVRYYFQNINDDFYTERSDLYRTSEATTGTIIEDDELSGPVASQTVGFTMMYHIPEAVAADGSTVFECYYDRNYHLIMFDNNGGYGVDPIYARYGAAFVVNDPVRHGYQFAGWDDVTANAAGDSNADTLPSTIPDENKNYKAIWTTVNTTYTVVYWKENANDNGYSYWGHKEKSALSASPVSATDSAAADGMEDAEHFTFNSAISDKNVFVEGDGTTVINAYYSRNLYTITFIDNSTTGVSCKIPTDHTHTDACYDYICNSTLHIHDSNCNLTCTTEPHTHDPIACGCSVKEHTHSSDCCSIPPHTHGQGDCACKLEEHTHSLSCYTTQTPTKVSDLGYYNYNAIQAHNALLQNVSTPTSGNVYRYSYNTGSSWRPSYTTYNFFYFNGTWYYLNTGTNYAGINVNLNNPDNNNFTSGAASTRCNKTEHTHGINCNCDQVAHDHTSGCNIADCDNGGIEHTHGDGNCNYTCGKTAHVHDASCYDCGEDLHEHVDSCKRLICPIPENHTHSNCSRVVYHIRAKYQQDIYQHWPITSYEPNATTYGSGQRWDPSQGAPYEEVLVYISSMPDANFSLTLNTSSNSTKTMTYYLEVLPGSEYDKEYQGRFFKIQNTIKANYSYITYNEDFFEIAGYERWTSYPTFTGNELRNTSTADFYYTRTVTHIIEFNNHGTVLTDKETTGIMVGASLSHLNFTPDYPTNLEPNAYYFDGWYTSPGCFPGTEVNWSTFTQPDDDVMLYAKWSPQAHTVTFFKTLDELKEYEAGTFTGTPFAVRENITHGNVVGSIEHPTRTGDGDTALVFTGWFYLENGSKKAFDPLNMPVKKDLNIFADWSSNSPQPYRVQYVLKNDHSKKVADDSAGFAYAGSTRTFLAKTGNPNNQLYDEYKSGFFPLVASHSITMEFEDDPTNPVHNVFTFEYVQATNIEYRVRFVDKQTNLPLSTELIKHTSDAVVTERFLPIANMVPDAFYKRLVISVEDDGNGNYVGTEENVITFYYTPNSESAYYAVHFMLQKFDPSTGLAGDPTNYDIHGNGGYESSGSHIEGIGTIGADVEIVPQQFAGFELIQDHAISVADGSQKVLSSLNGNGAYTIKVTQTGTELYVFYKRQQFDYTVHYYKHNTTTSLKDSIVIHDSYYGATVSQTAPKIDGYTVVSDETQDLTIHNKPENNVIIFYYAEIQYVVEYIIAAPKPPEKEAWLSNTIEVKEGTNPFEGSTPNFNAKNYRFVGWFKDEACQQSAADYGTITGNTFLPDKAKLSETESNKFYAKFELLAGDLTIVRQGAPDDNQMFVYKVTNGTDLTIWVTIMGNDSTTIHDLPFGNYTITQENDWSWRYGDPGFPGLSFPHDGTNEATFNYNSRNQWLTGNSVIGKDEAGGT